MYGLTAGKEAFDMALFLAGIFFIPLLTGVIAAAAVAAGVGAAGASISATPSVERLVIVGLIAVNDSATATS